MNNDVEMCKASHPAGTCVLWRRQSSSSSSQAEATVLEWAGSNTRVLLDCSAQGGSNHNWVECPVWVIEVLPSLGLVMPRVQPSMTLSGVLDYAALEQIIERFVEPLPKPKNPMVADAERRSRERGQLEPHLVPVQSAALLQELDGPLTQSSALQFLRSSHDQLQAIYHKERDLRDSRTDRAEWASRVYDALETLSRAIGLCSAVKAWPEGDNW